MRVLLVEDDADMAQSLKASLAADDHEVEIAGDGELGQSMASTGGYDVIVLDRMLPKKLGVSVVRELRDQGVSTPVLILSALHDEDHRVEGLNAGANDYLGKPFSTRELLARVKSVLRRSRNGEAPAEVVESGDLRIDPRTHTATLGGREVTLSPKEFALLHFLASHPGQVFSRDTLLDRVWGQDAYVSARTVDVHVRWLREHVETEPSRPVRLLTVRGVGYKFVA